MPGLISFIAYYHFIYYEDLNFRGVARTLPRSHSTEVANLLDVNTAAHIYGTTLPPSSPAFYNDELGKLETWVQGGQASILQLTPVLKGKAVIDKK